MRKKRLVGNKDKVILDLCGGTGAWSKDYREAGYDVRIITLPKGISLTLLWDKKEQFKYDVRLYTPPKNVYGILAAPPCTYFCRMRMCRGRPTNEQFIKGLSVVDACLRIIAISNPKFWALENPIGYLKIWLGEPTYKFDPYYFGDAWTKRTWLWGKFNLPKEKRVKSIRQWVNDGSNNGISRNSLTNAITPAGFAKAFFEANR